MKNTLLYLLIWLLGLSLLLAGPIQAAAAAVSLENQGLRLELDPRTGLPERIQTRLNGNLRSWLAGSVQLRVRNQVTATQTELGTASGQLNPANRQAPEWRGALKDLPLRLSQQWSATAQGVAWDLDFQGDATRVEHQVSIDLPVLSNSLRIFTPTEHGVMQLAAYPTFKPGPYAAIGWDTGESYVLPLISLFDPQTDQALTVALPADANIPHLQFEWRDARVLTLTLARRGMGGGRSSPLRLLWFTHPADYRSVLQVYSEAFPAWFRTTAHRDHGEGAFYYHHIQAHPDFEEMKRQRVRYLWSSFWFTHLGEYLPVAQEWEPYTYAKWWKLGQTMSDAKILDFISNLREQGIRTYAYFNVTEYGGAGGKSGDTAEAARILREKFANALIKNAQGRDIPTWEGAMAMNPGRRYALWPFLEDQVQRHLQRLPGLEGFVMDRLDWASVLDYGHDDGLSMVGNQAVENMALPVREAVQAVARLAHNANKKLFVNQFYRIEVLQDVDGFCHENDYLPAMGYLTPLRPASAWHMRKPYQGDLLQFEAQLKRRLHWALFPQMIAHEFPISQQPPNPQAADFLELYAPLFDTLLGKEQVLLPHCVEVTGANDVNLFRVANGNYVAPITSRTRFRSRPEVGAEEVELSLRVPDATALQWAQAVSADGLTASTRIRTEPGLARIRLSAHGTATMLVIGKGTAPALPETRSVRLDRIRERQLVKAPPIPQPMPRPSLQPEDHLFLCVAGTHLGAAGLVNLALEDTQVGSIPAKNNKAMIPMNRSALTELPPRVSLQFAEEGIWFVPEQIQLVARREDGSGRRLGCWQTGMPMVSTGNLAQLCLPLVWNEGPLNTSSARFLTRPKLASGRWQDQLGSQAVWIPNVTGNDKAQNGWRLEVQNGHPFTWPSATSEDPRILSAPKEGRPVPTCWFADENLVFHLIAPDNEPYQLTIYGLDYDRNGRAMEVTVSDDMATLDTQRLQTAETAPGICLKWSVRGSVNLEIHKVAGFNVVLSGVFVDRETGARK